MRHVDRLPRLAISREVAVAATYIGAVVGAGFASGKEIYIFFTSLGPASRTGIIISTCLFALVGGALLDFSSSLKRNDIGGLLAAAFGAAGSRLLAPVMVAFAYGALAIMLAGGGALGSMGAGLDEGAGTLITAFIVAAVVLNGASGILISNVILVPVMLMAIAYISILSVGRPPSPLASSTAETAMNALGVGAPIIYTSYNLMLVMGMFAAVGNGIPGRRSAYLSALLGGIGVGLLLGIVNETMLRHQASLVNSDIPMLTIAISGGAAARIVYQAAVYTAMITSATSAAYTIGKRLGSSMNLNPDYVGAGITFLAVPLARMGFTALLTHIYPLAGYVGIPMIAGILVRYVSAGFVATAGSCPKNK